MQIENQTSDDDEGQQGLVGDLLSDVINNIITINRKLIYFMIYQNHLKTEHYQAMMAKLDKECLEEFTAEEMMAKITDCKLHAYPSSSSWETHSLIESEGNTNDSIPTLVDESQKSEEFQTQGGGGGDDDVYSQI